jgi:hypothetical protein
MQQRDEADDFLEGKGGLLEMLTPLQPNSLYYHT